MQNRDRDQQNRGKGQKYFRSYGGRRASKFAEKTAAARTPSSAIVAA
jgi:hypothetical protein